jgi:hypothetical protein
MNKEALKQWALALWSGEYEQGQGGLCTLVNGGFLYCCLGVAAELFYKQLGMTKEQDKHSDALMYAFQGNRQGGYMPAEIGEYLGIESSFRDIKSMGYDPILIDPETGYSYQASYWNDSGKKSFKEIAMMINHTFDLGLDLTDKD